MSRVLYITVPEQELFDESKMMFVTVKEQKLALEHSLVSLSKWESKWNKAFLSKTEKTQEEVIDYIRCMTITQNVSEDTYKHLTAKNINDILEYIKSSQSATWFNDKSTTGRSNEVVTSELIYYWMVALQIPFECQKWHLNRLMTLIRICEIKNRPPKKMSKSAIRSRNRALNEARRKQLGTTG